MSLKGSQNADLFRLPYKALSGRRAKELQAASMAKQQPTTAKQFSSLWSLGDLTPWQLVHNVFEEIRASNIFGRASELAFYFLFALFPLILLLMTLFGLFASHESNFKTF